MKATEKFYTHIETTENSTSTMPQARTTTAKADKEKARLAGLTYRSEKIHVGYVESDSNDSLPPCRRDERGEVIREVKPIAKTERRESGHLVPIVNQWIVDADKLQFKVDEVRKSKTKDAPNLAKDAAALAALADSNDIVMRYFYEVVESAKAAARDYVAAESRTAQKAIYAYANSLDNDELTDFLASNFDSALNGDANAVAIFYCYAARLAMGKLKGKCQRHADNEHIRRRRFKTVKGFHRFASLGGAFEYGYTTETITAKLNEIMSDLYEKCIERFPTAKDAERALVRYGVKSALRYIVSEMIEIAKRQESKAFAPLASDIEIVNECAAALIEYFRETHNSDFNAAADITENYFDGWYDRINNIVSTRTINICGRVYAMRRMDNFIGQYKTPQDIANTRDIENTATGTLERGVKYLNDAERAEYIRACNAIENSERFPNAAARFEASTILYMRMCGYGYKVIARFMEVTPQRVRDTLPKIAAALRSDKKYAALIKTERRANRSLVAVRVTVGGEYIDSNAAAKAATAAKAAASLAAADVETMTRAERAAHVVEVYNAERAAERAAAKAATAAERETLRDIHAAENSRREALNINREKSRAAALKGCANIATGNRIYARQGGKAKRITETRVLSPFEKAAKKAAK